MSSLESQALIFGALADENRRLLLNALRVGGGQTAAELFENTGLQLVMTMKGLRKHLGVLKAAGLVRFESGQAAGLNVQVIRLQRKHLYGTLSPWLTKFKGPVGTEFDRQKRHRDPRFRLGMVWLNLPTGVFHSSASRYFGNTPSGRFMSRHDAIKQGFDGAKMHRVTRLPSREELDLWFNRDEKLQAVTLKFNTVPGHQYHIQCCDDGMSEFQTLDSFVALPEQKTHLFIDMFSHDARHRFYRIMRSPTACRLGRMEGWHDSRTDG